MVLTFQSADEILSVTIQMKATEQYFLVMPFIMLCKVVITIESVDEFLKCDHLNQSTFNSILLWYFIMLYK